MLVVAVNAAEEDGNVIVNIKEDEEAMVVLYVLLDYYIHCYILRLYTGGGFIRYNKCRINLARILSSHVTCIYIYHHIDSVISLYSLDSQFPLVHFYLPFGFCDSII